MSVLGNIVSAIFGQHAAAQAPAAGPGPAAQKGTASTPPAASSPAASSPATAPAASSPAASSPATAPAASSPAASSPAAPPASVDVAAILSKLAAQSKEKLDWRNSIVDLMKLLNLDSSLSARKTLAQELHYTGDTNDSASMNIWLHKQVMIKLADNGGKVPAELTH